MVKLTARERYEFKKVLKELGSYKGRSTELISLYVPGSKQVSDVMSYLRNEFSQSSNIKSKSTRKNVTSAIESIMSRLKNLRMAPENGLAFFVGHIPTGADQTKMIARVVEPPMEITTFLYRCDSYFYLDHLKAMMIDEDVFGLIVVDRSEATVGLLKGKRIELIKNIQSLVPSKHGRGGQSAQRFERLIEIAAHEYYKKLTDICTEAFLGVDELKGILIGGPGSTKDFFLKNEYLHHELQRKVVDTFDTGYTNEFGLGELLEKALPTLQHLDVSKEKELMRRLFSEIRKEDGGLSAYGEAQVRQALEAGAVEILLVSEGLKRSHQVWRCSGCGNEEERYVTSKAGDSEKCGKCGGLSELTLDEDIIDEMDKICEKYSSVLELISTDSSEGTMLLRAFGGIAALLRYRVVF